MTGYVRQAVVVVHGMGEQLPLDTSCGFINAALAPDEQGMRRFYSRPESVTGSFESRRFLAPKKLAERRRAAADHSMLVQKPSDIAVDGDSSEADHLDGQVLLLGCYVLGGQIVLRSR